MICNFPIFPRSCDPAFKKYLRANGDTYAFGFEEEIWNKLVPGRRLWIASRPVQNNCRIYEIDYVDAIVIKAVFKQSSGDADLVSLEMCTSLYEAQLLNRDLLTFFAYLYANPDNYYQIDR